MDIFKAIDALNESSRPQIEVVTTRSNRTIAKLPRTSRQVTLKVDPSFEENVKVTARDMAWLCEEARRASAPGMDLLEAALGALKDVDPDR